MFHSLASYFLGGTDTTGGVDNGDDNNTRVDLRTTDHEDGWTLVDRESDGDSERYSSEEEDNVTEDGLERVRLGRASSSESLNNGGHNTNRTSLMDESWFVTPPPCFSSQTGPVQLVTSPLENLLIEHPSMSVYVRNGSRHPLLRTPPPSDIADEEEEEEEIELESDEMFVMGWMELRLRHSSELRAHMAASAAAQRSRVATPAAAQQVDVATPVAAASHRCNRAQPVLLGPGQLARTRQAQKLQMKKLAQQATRGHLNRSNKAREVNGRNWNPRRKERCQGSARSHANNNRKC